MGDKLAVGLGSSCEVLCSQHSLIPIAQLRSPAQKLCRSALPHRQVKSENFLTALF
jgi:hypothetical protein